MVRLLDGMVYEGKPKQAGLRYCDVNVKTLSLQITMLSNTFFVRFSYCVLRFGVVNISKKSLPLIDNMQALGFFFLTVRYLVYLMRVPWL